MGRWPKFLKSLKETGLIIFCVFYLFVYSSLGSGLLMNEWISDLSVWAENYRLCFVSNWDILIPFVCVGGEAYCYLKQFQICFLMGVLQEYWKDIWIRVACEWMAVLFTHLWVIYFCKEPHFHWHYTLASHFSINNCLSYTAFVVYVRFLHYPYRDWANKLDSLTKRVMKVKCIYKMI